MLRKYRNIDARTLNLRTGKHQFPVRTAQYDDEEDVYTEDAMSTPENLKAGDIDYLEQLEYRQSVGEDLSSEERETLKDLSIKYQDAMGRTVPTEFSEERAAEDEPTSAFEGLPSESEERGAVQREKSVEKQEAEDSARKELRQLLLKKMWGQDLSDEEQERADELQKQFPDIMKRLTGQDVAMMGMHRPETDKSRAPSADEVSHQLGHPFDKFFIPEPLRDPNGEIAIDPEVASEEDRLGADYGSMKYVPDFLKSEEHLKGYRKWIESLQGLDPNLVDTNPLSRVPAPPWYSLGEQEKSQADVADRTLDVSGVLQNVNQLSPEDTRVYTEMFNRILQDWPSYGPSVKQDVIPQFRELLKTKFDMTPDEAGDVATEVQMALTKEIPMDTRRVLEKADIIEQRLQRGEPVTQKDRAREYRRLQKVIDALGQPLDLQGAASWIESVQNDGRWKRSVVRGETPEGVNFTIDPNEALVSTYNFVAQSPLPDSVKKSVADILMDPAPFKAFKQKGRGNIGYSKLEQVMNMLSEFALGQYGLYNPDQERNRKDLYKMDQQQRAERQKLLRTHEQLTEILQRTFGLSHGESLDYLRNTVDGLTTWKDVMNEQAGPKIKTVRDQYESIPGPETRDFLGQFEYGAPEAFLILSGAAKNRTRFPNAPYTELEGDEIDGRVLEALQRLWLDPGDKFGRDRLKKFFPGKMQVPTVTPGDPEQGEDPEKEYLKMKNRERSDVTILQDPAVLMGISELVRQKREQEGGGMRYQRLDRTPSQRTRPFDPRKKDPPKKKLPERHPPFTMRGLNLGRDNLSLDRESLRLEKVAEKAENIFNMLADYTEALGAGAPLSELRKLFDAKRLRRKEQEGERKEDLDIMYNKIRSGLLERGGYDYTIPPEAREAADRIYTSRDLGILEQYEQMQDLLHNQLSRPKTPEFARQMQEYVLDRAGAPPSLEYSPQGRAHQDYLDSVTPAMETGAPLSDRPSTHTKPPAGTPAEAPTPLREQREKPDAAALGVPVESRPIDISETEGTGGMPGIDLGKMEEEIRRGEPRVPAKPRGREDVFDDAAYQKSISEWEERHPREFPMLEGFHPGEQVAPEEPAPFKDQPEDTAAVGEEHEADSLPIGEVYGEGWIKIPREMEDRVKGIADVNRKVPVGKDYSLVRARDPEKQEVLLSEVSDFLLSEQGLEPEAGGSEYLDEARRMAENGVEVTPALLVQKFPIGYMEATNIMSQLGEQAPPEEDIDSLLAPPTNEEDDLSTEGLLSLRRKSLCLFRLKK